MGSLPKPLCRRAFDVGIQCCRWVHRLSFFLAALTVFDALIVSLIAVEWRSRQVISHQVMSPGCLLPTD